MIGHRGASVASGPNGLVLQSGSVFISASEEPLFADTPAGRISVSAHSNLFVQQHSSGVLIIANLGLSSASLDLGRNGQNCTESIGPGAELIVADEYFGPREMDEELGIRSHYEIAHCHVPGITFIRHKMLAKEIRDKEKIVDCDPVRYPERYLKQRIHSIRSVTGHLLSKAPDANLYEPDQTFNRKPERIHNDNDREPKEVSLVPISFIAPPTAPTLRVAKNNGVFLAQLGQADIERDSDGVLTLNEGEILIRTTQPTSFKAGTCLIVLQPGAAVLAEKTADLVKIRNIHESKAHSVEIKKPGGNLLSLQLTDEIIISADKRTATHSLSDRVGRRRIRDFKLQSGWTLTKSEFSLVSLLTENKLLQTLRNSKDRECVKLHNQILKTAVCHWLVKGNRKPYNSIHPED